jgi:hypothetical protein
MSLKRWWFEKSIKPVQNSSHYYQDRKNQIIGVVSDLENGVEETKAIKKYFHHPGTTIYQLHYTQNVPQENHYYFGNKNISWYGFPKGELVQSFLDRQYDICFFMIEKPTLPMEFLLRSVKASLRMGFYHKEYEPFLDFSLDINKESSHTEMVRNLIREADQLLFKV